jgi:mutator protein MutT
MLKPTYDVALALVHRGGMWLVARRKRTAHLGGLWEFPGGKCLPNETPAQAALRELFEECGVQASVERVAGTFNREYDDRVVRLTAVVCRWEHGQAEPLGSAACRWVSRGQLAQLEMPPVNADVIRAALGVE